MATASKLIIANSGPGLATQDITPYGNGLDHVNSILQPATATSAPVVGVALTAEIAVPGCATGATREIDIEAASRFCIEVAKGFGAGACGFYDPANFKLLMKLYGPMHALQTNGQIMIESDERGDQSSQ
ncbi:MAG: DUF1177 family protein [Congregibacter sp.]